jgi:hypothetical protein
MKEDQKLNKRVNRKVGQTMKNKWLTDEQRQICVGYNDGMMGQDNRRTGSDFYRLGYHAAMHDKAKGLYHRTGREVALANS